MLDGTQYFECDCGSVEHTLRFVLDKDDKQIHTEIYLNQYRSWLMRIWVGIRYIFGYKCKCGEWDCWMLSKDDAIRLRDMCNEIIDS